MGKDVTPAHNATHTYGPDGSGICHELLFGHPFLSVTLFQNLRLRALGVWSYSTLLLNIHAPIHFFLTSRSLLDSGTLQLIYKKTIFLSYHV